MSHQRRSAHMAVPISETEAVSPPAQPGAPDLAGPPDLAASLARAQRGDPDAFRALYRDTQPRLLRYLHALVGDDAEDIASEACLQVARDLHAFHGDYAGFPAWAPPIAPHPPPPPLP